MTAREWSWRFRRVTVAAYLDPGTFGVGLTLDRFRRGDLLVTLAFGPWSATGRWGW